ncbi:MAG: hypothetical protein KKA61_04525 [Nanoarchaeota archaeon]|nr:hypothetical protein [Nanoarchaeota archaeon]
MKEKDFVIKVKKKHLWAILAVIVIIAVVFAVKPYLKKNRISVVDSSDIIVLNDQRCKECDVTRVTSQLKSSFPDFVVGEIDYIDEEGKKVYMETGLTVLPAILFKDNVKEEEGYSDVERYLNQKGDFLSLMIGANFDPTKEICDNEIDDTGNNLVDCNDNDCKGSLKCREEKKNHLQVFIMSDCPYGRKAGEALKGIVDNFKDLIDYEVHYIASEQGDGFRSLHGQYEVDENIIQLCVNEHNPTKFIDYLYCRSTKGVRDKDWKDCGNEVSVDIDKIQTCFDGDQGKGLLMEDIKIAQDLGVTGSPTWLANNRYKFGGIDAEAVKNSFCKYNEGLEGCDNTLGSSSTPGGTC